jgi:hypothetical protein
MKVGEIAGPEETAEGFVLLSLVAQQPERLRSLDERHREIEEILRRPRFESLMTEYKKHLAETASVSYPN